MSSPREIRSEISREPILRALRLRERHGGGPEDRSSGNWRLNEALRDKLRIDRSNQTVTTFSVRQHWRSPSVPANNFPGGNSLPAKRVVIELGLGCVMAPRKTPAAIKRGTCRNLTAFSIAKQVECSGEIALPSARLRPFRPASIRGRPAFRDQRWSPRREACRARDRSLQRRRSGFGTDHRPL